ncbi:uncharacterized protein LOC143287247 [Babylonia areolata]|uniref:uncharacterized protein LOC143287247 n=1 Tax=Babylonia areolata TaxID=304850 RepID=UPI003FD00EB7
MLKLVVWVGVMVGVALAITKPNGCTYSSGVFTCDYRYVLPLDANAFTPEPQRLVIEEVSGTFSSTDFVNFNNVNKSAFDINFPAELTIYCTTGGGGLLNLDSTSFTGMGFYNEIRIINCEFTAIAASAFANFGSVNHFSFEGGNMDGIDSDALLGLNVIKDLSLPSPKGSFALIDVDLVPGGLPAGFLSNMTQAHELTLTNSRLYTIDLDTFSAAATVKKFNLDNNPFTYLPDNLFSAAKGLGAVSMAGISWECTCNNLWFLKHFSDNDILFNSPATCTLPSSHFGATAYKYYSDICDSGPKCAEGTIPSVDVGVTCLTVLQIIIYVLAVFAFGFGITALIIACQTRSKLKAMSGGGGGKKAGGGGGGGGPKRGGNNRVSQRPPAGTRPPVKKNAFN